MFWVVFFIKTTGEENYGNIAVGATTFAHQCGRCRRAVKDEQERLQKM